MGILPMSSLAAAVVDRKEDISTGTGDDRPAAAAAD